MSKGAMVFARLGLAAVLLAGGAAVYAGVDPGFKEYNPDIQKYDFAKSYISGLSYYDRVSVRLQQEESSRLAAKDDAGSIKKLIDNRTRDNTELRIARNYVKGYFTSKNGLIRKVAVSSAGAYDRLLAMSVREREMWIAYLKYKTSGQPADLNVSEFMKQLVHLAGEKKEVSKDLVGATSLLTRVLLSARECDTEDCKVLALSAAERRKLSEHLDQFAGENMDWGMKPGQSITQACVAVLREVLEDSIYQSRQ